MNDDKQNLNPSLVEYCIALADDALILGQRLSEWCAQAPYLEEDLALANVALDFIGRASLLYDYAAELEGGQRNADQIAFLRDEREYRNLLIYELPNGDFAFTLARQLILDVFNVEYLQRLQSSSDARLAAIAGKAIKESRYHLRRSQAWVPRLGDGTEESHARIQAAFDELWPYTHELFEMTPAESALLSDGIAVVRQGLRDDWERRIKAVLAEATLRCPASDNTIRGGRQGLHTEHLGYMLCEMQYMQRAYPGLEW